MPSSNWTLVRDAIDADISSGRLKPGERLPSELELCKLHDAGRHSVRRAMSALAMDGKIRIQQGRGTFVETPELIRYTVGRRTRLRQNLREQGLAPGGIMLGSSTGQAEADVARALGIGFGDRIIKSTHLTTADNVPVAFGSIYHVASMFPGYADRRVKLGSVTAVYESYGVRDYVRADTTVHTRRATTEEAAVLAQHPEMPVMIVQATDSLPDGTPISFARVAWAGARVRFSFESDPVDTRKDTTRKTQNA